MYFVASTVLVIGLTVFGVGCEIIAVIQLFRHGQRTPITYYANDPYKDPSYWSGLDAGQLTNEGKRQLFELGQYTRERYSKFLPKRYDRAFFYAETTNVDRTHMSAQTNIYSLFQATGDQVWHKNINWQPIPIHPADDNIWSSLFFPTSCTAYNAHLANALTSAEYEQIDQQYSSLYKFLTRNSGNNVTGLENINYIWDPLKIEDSVGYSLPSWTKEVYPEPLSTLVGLLFERVTYTTSMKRIVSGPFLNEVVTYLEAMAEDPTSSQKFRIYSGHDTNIAATLNALGAFNPPYPPDFGSSIYIELHQENWNNIVKVFGKNGNNLTQFSVNGCALSCPLTEFRTRLSDIIVDVKTRNAECDQVVEGTSRLLLSKSEKYTADNVEKTFKNWIN